MPSHPSGAKIGDQHVRLCIPGLAVRSKVWFEVDGRFAIGEGGVELLDAIARESSLAGAARRVGWSYRHAWGYVRRAEAVLGVQLVTIRAGRGGDRGATLTGEARRLVGTVSALSRAHDKSSIRSLAALQRLERRQRSLAGR